MKIIEKIEALRSFLNDRGDKFGEISPVSEKGRLFDTTSGNRWWVLTSREFSHELEEGIILWSQLEDTSEDEVTDRIDTGDLYADEVINGHRGKWLNHIFKLGSENVSIIEASQDCVEKR